MTEPHLPEDNNADGDSLERWAQGLDTLNYYDLLGVTEQDDLLACERAYHRFALRFHPDRSPDADGSVRATLTRIFQRGVEARRVLCDPERRKLYRVRLKQGAVRLSDDHPVATVDLDNALPSLHHECRSAGAKLEAMAAARAWQARDMLVVHQHLIRAWVFDGKANATIERCVEAIELAQVD